MEEKKNSYLCCVVFIIFIHAAPVNCQSFDNLTSREIEPQFKRRIIKDLRDELNNTNGAVELALASRYPDLLGVAAGIVNISENSTDFNEARLCLYIKDMLLGTQDLCGISIDKKSPCHLPQEFLKNVSDLCPIKESNKTDGKEPVGRQIVTEYFLLAVKLLTGTAKKTYERSCIKRGGQLNHRVDKCILSSPMKNESVYNYGIHTEAPEDDILFIISLTGNILSLICSALLLITYVILEKYKTVPGKSTMCLSSTLIATNASQIIVLYLHDNSTICITLAVLLHWFFLCSFFWMSALAYDYFITFHRFNLISSNAKAFRFRVYFLIAFALPTAAVIICLALDIPNKSITHYGANGKCFIVGLWTNLCAFVIPVALLVSINISLLCFTINNIQGLKKSTRNLSASNRRETLLIFMAIKLAILVGAAWIMAFIDGFVSNTIIKYLYTIIVTYQGFFVYVAFGFFMPMLKRVTNSITHANRTPEKAPTKDSRL